MPGAAGFGGVWARDPGSGLAVMLGAINFVHTVTPTTEDVLGSDDCDASLQLTKAIITQRLEETLTITSAKVTDGTFQLIKGRRMATAVTNVRHVKNACFTVPVPLVGDTETTTSATAANLAGLAAADTSSVTAVFQVAEGVENEATIVGVAPAAANEIQIVDDGVVTHTSNSGQNLVVQFETTGTLPKAIGGSLTTVQSPRIASVQVHGIVELLNGGGKWRFWAPDARSVDARTFDPTADTSFGYRLSTPAGWSDPSLLYQIA